MYRIEYNRKDCCPLPIICSFDRLELIISKLLIDLFLFLIFFGSSFLCSWPVQAIFQEQDEGRRQRVSVIAVPSLPSILSKNFLQAQYTG